MKVYHVALLLRDTTAVFQFRKDKDTLSCEPLDYIGKPRTTKTDAKRRLAFVFDDALASIKAPHLITKIAVD